MFQNRILRRVSIIAGIGFGGYVLDKYAYASTFERNFRTVVAGVLITLDYKLNFQPGDPSKIDQLHQRVAERIFNVCKKNGGLYIKFGT